MASGSSVKTLEIKSYAEETKYVIILSGHMDTVLEALALLQIRKDRDYVALVEAAKTSGMPEQAVDSAGSSIRMFVNNYIRLKHVTKRSTTEGVDVYSREQISDVLMSNGWELAGFSSHEGYTKTGMAVVQMWVKKATQF